MQITTIGFSTLALVAALGTTAAAAPTDFDGTYHLTCQEATYTLHLDIAGELDGRPISYNPPNLEFNLPCEADDPAIPELVDSVHQHCLDGGLGRFCDDVVVPALEGAIHGTIAMVPVELTTQIIDPNNGWAKLFRLYSTRVTHLYDNGDVDTSKYILNDGSRHNGHFLQLSLNLDDVLFGGPAGCVATTLGRINGNIDRNADFAMTWKPTVDRSLSCGVVLNNGWLAGIIGVTFKATASGERASD